MNKDFWMYIGTMALGMLFLILSIPKEVYNYWVTDWNLIFLILLIWYMVFMPTYWYSKWWASQTTDRPKIMIVDKDGNREATPEEIEQFFDTNKDKSED